MRSMAWLMVPSPGKGSAGKSLCFHPRASNGSSAAGRNQNTLPKGAMGVFSPDMGTLSPSSLASLRVLS